MKTNALTFIPYLAKISTQYFIGVFILVSSTSAQDGSSEKVNVDWGPSSNGIRSALTTKKTNFSLDEPVLLTYRLENHSEKGISFSNKRSQKGFVKMEIFQVEPNKRIPIPLTRYGQRLFQIPAINSISTTFINPGEYYLTDFFKLPVNRVYDMSVAGNYEITTKRFVNSSQYITTNTLKIKIVQPVRRESETGIDGPFIETIKKASTKK